MTWTVLVVVVVWLFCQRDPRQDYGLLWHCPGGKVEPGESLDDALLREVREEIGVMAWSPLEMSIADLCFRPPGSEERFIRWFPIEIGTAKPMPCEGVGVGWFPPSALMAGAGLLTVATERVLGALLAYLNGPDRGA